MEKQLLRNNIKIILNNLSAQVKMMKSQRISSLLFTTKWWKNADIVLLYLSMADEVNTAPVIEQALAEDKKLYIPRMYQNRLIFHRFDGEFEKTSQHPYGLREPLAHTPTLDFNKLKHNQILVIVPGLALDHRKHRLGRGKGFYDRFLTYIHTIKGLKSVHIALCFKEQLVDKVPVDKRDQPVDGIVTDKEVI